MVRLTHNDEKPGKLKPPVNYLSRRQQYRMLMLVGSLMLVFVLMLEAGKPKNWQWMWAGGAGQFDQQPDGADRSGEPIDSRLATKSFVQTKQLPGTITVDRPRPQPFEPIEREQGQRKAEKDAWSGLLKQLDWRQRELLSRALKSVRDRVALKDDQRQAWRQLVDVLDKGWHRYLQTTTQAVRQDTGLTDREKADWMVILRQLEKSWTGQLKGAFHTVGSPAQRGDGQRRALSKFQRLHDEMAIDAIRDDTFDRPAEREAWFRLFEKLSQASEADLEKMSVGWVGYNQLHRQCKDYRAKLVTVKGTARMAYHVRAPNNIHGIEGYYVFVLRPLGGPNLPIRVVSLQAPPGFPPIKDRGQDQQRARLREDLEVTGYFFKRGAYRARDGLRTCPVVLAKVPRWEPPSPGRQAALPSSGLIVVAVAAVAALAISLAAMAHACTGRRGLRKKYLSSSPASIQQLSSLEDTKGTREVGASLTKLAEEEINP